MIVKYLRTFIVTIVGAAHVAHAQDDTELAKAAQNPLASMISLPFQSNTNFDHGPQEKTQEVLNIQPVLPFVLNDDWLLVTRTILPIISQPPLTPEGDRTNGLGDTTFTGWFVPAAKQKWTLGLGPVVVLPTCAWRITNFQIDSGTYILQSPNPIHRIISVEYAEYDGLVSSL